MKIKKPAEFQRVFYGRGSRIRTCGLCVPNATLYQAELYLDANMSGTSYLISIQQLFESCKCFFKIFRSFFSIFLSGIRRRKPQS